MLIVGSEIMVILLALRNSTNQKRIWLRSRQLHLLIKLSTQVFAATSKSIWSIVKRTLPRINLTVNRKPKSWMTSSCKYNVRKTSAARAPSRSFNSKTAKPLEMHPRSRLQCSNLQTKLKIRIRVKRARTWLRVSAIKCCKRRTSNSKRKLSSSPTSLFKLSQP